MSDEVELLRENKALRAEVTRLGDELRDAKAELARVDVALDHEPGDRAALIYGLKHRVQHTQGAASTHFDFRTR